MPMTDPTILIVDDESDLVESLVERLELRGFNVTGVTSGTEALHLLREISFDVVVADVKMPKLGGIELLRRIRQRTLRRRVAGPEVVLMTGHGSREDLEAGKRHGAFDYVMKPIRIEELLEIVRAAAKRREGRRG